MQRAAALRAKLSDWVGESRPRKSQYSALVAALDGFASEIATNPQAEQPIADRELAAASKLARLAMEFNELLMAHVMDVSFRVADDIEEWQIRKENKYWFVWEKTPIFWAYYFTMKGREPLALEARKKVAKLQHLQRNLTAFLGVGSRLMDMYTCAMQQEDKHSLIKVMSANQQVLRTCFGIVSRISSDNAADIAASITMQSFSLPSESCSMNAAEQGLKLNVEGFLDFTAAVDEVVEANSRPPYYSSHWLKLSVYGVAGYFALTELADNKLVILDTAKNLRISTWNFTERYIAKPLIEMYRTIRYDKSSFHVIDPSEIKSDEDSLSRMVSDYVASHKGGVSLSKSNTGQSDFSAIMPAYEKALAEPVRNAVFGDLFRLLLIQVQKGRVDAERALQALDKLLRSNELNFQMLALVPAIFISYLTTNWMFHFLFRRPNQRSLFRKLQMRNVSRILTDAHPEQTPVAQQPRATLSLLVTGSVLLSAQRIRILTDGLSAQARALLSEDLQYVAARELESLPMLSQKEAVVERMYRTHAFLWPREQ